MMEFVFGSRPSGLEWAVQAASPRAVAQNIRGRNIVRIRTAGHHIALGGCVASAFISPRFCIAWRTHTSALSISSPFLSALPSTPYWRGHHHHEAGTFVLGL